MVILCIQVWRYTHPEEIHIRLQDLPGTTENFLFSKISYQLEVFWTPKMVEIHLQTSVKPSGCCELHATMSLSTSVSVYSPNTASRTPFGLPAIPEGLLLYFQHQKDLDLLSIPWAKGLSEWKLHITGNQQSIRAELASEFHNLSPFLHFISSRSPYFLAGSMTQFENPKPIVTSTCTIFSAYKFSESLL